METVPLFVAVPSALAGGLCASLGEAQIREAAATVFECGFGDERQDWWVDTAEI